MSDEVKTWNGVELGGETFYWAMQWVIQCWPRLHELGYRDGVCLLLPLIAKRTKADGSNVAWPSQKTIAKEAGLSERSVRYAIHEMVAGGILKVSRAPRSGFGGWHNRYQILPEVDGHVWTPVQEQIASTGTGTDCLFV